MGMMINPYAAASAEIPDYANPGGIGDRTAIIDISANFTPTDGTINNLIDGNTAANGTDSIKWDNNQAKWILFDFKVGVKKKITEFIIKQSNTGITQGTWWFQGSNNLTQWDVLLEFTFGHGTFTPASPTPGGYRYYRLFCRLGTLNTALYTEEIEFKICNDATAIFDSHTASYDYRGGRGQRTDGADLTITTTLATNSGDLFGLMDGHLPNSSSDFNTDPATSIPVGWRISSNQTTGRYIRWQFPSQVIMTEWQWNQASAISHNTWRLQGSNDGSSWTNIGATFTFGGGSVGSFDVRTEASGNTTAYFYYQIIGTSGNTSIALGEFGEFEFKLHD